MNIKLEEKNIFLNLDTVSKEEAIIRAGEELVKLGCVDKEYIDYMLEREKLATTYMGLGIAIPHGINEAKKTIHESGLVFLQYPNGVDFDGEKAYLVIGIAGKGDEHLEVLSSVAIKISEELTEKLKNTTNKQDFLDEFGE
ncbi:PTS sugar transporter subunit IIA [uncultured Anaerococcus sp.]|uniref:PTS sugar transporter subunit IIA n=1 Tax=uncultured Anaerococcus sp. TaxID=293428 RepID=UPI00260D2E95|nr:PTS sugar transporter subunit IIA [uncultured Anaerococcus sp.]